MRTFILVLTITVLTVLAVGCDKAAAPSPAPATAAQPAVVQPQPEAAAVAMREALGVKSSWLKTKKVSGTGFTFEVPATWDVSGNTATSPTGAVCTVHVFEDSRPLDVFVSANLTDLRKTLSLPNLEIGKETKSASGVICQGYVFESGTERPGQVTFSKPFERGVTKWTDTPARKFVITFSALPADDVKNIVRTFR